MTVHRLQTIFALGAIAIGTEISFTQNKNGMRGLIPHLMR